MASDSSGFDMSKVSTGEKIVLVSAILYVIWVFIPSWYSCCTIEGFGVKGTTSSGVNGFRGLLIVAWLLAVIAIVEIALRQFAGMKMALPVAHGLLHLIVGGLALLLTLLGLLLKPSESAFGISATANLSWGIFVGIVITLVWAYGAYMMYSEPAVASSTPAAPPAVPPPAPPSEPPYEPPSAPPSDPSGFTS